MDELLEEFWEWFDQEFKNRNPDETQSFEYKDLFKKFWEEKYWDAWDEVKSECFDKHCEIYEEPDYEGDYIDSCYAAEVGK